MTNSITIKQKREYFPTLIVWQFYKCCYCSLDIFSFKPIFEHLLDDPSCNDIIDVAIACQACNNKKSTSVWLKKKGKLIHEQWKDNMTRGSESVSSLPSLLSPGLKPEMTINRTNMQLTGERLDYYVSLFGPYPVRDTVDGITMYCYKKTGTGSQKVISQYVKAHCSIDGAFKIINDGKRDVIVKREDSSDERGIALDWEIILPTSHGSISD